jgi:hypothetical protein
MANLAPALYRLALLGHKAVPGQLAPKVTLGRKVYKDRKV